MLVMSPSLLDLNQHASDHSMAPTGALGGKHSCSSPLTLRSCTIDVLIEGTGKTKFREKYLNGPTDIFVSQYHPQILSWPPVGGIYI